MSRDTKIVAIGGGTGLSNLLSGLKHKTVNKIQRVNAIQKFNSLDKNHGISKNMGIVGITYQNV